MAGPGCHMALQEHEKLELESCPDVTERGLPRLGKVGGWPSDTDVDGGQKILFSSDLSHRKEGLPMEIIAVVVAVLGFALSCAIAGYHLGKDIESRHNDSSHKKKN